MLNTERELTPSWSLVGPSVGLIKKHYEAVLIIALLPALLAEYGSLSYAKHHFIGIGIIAAAGLWRLINTPVGYYLQTRAVKDKIPSLGECYAKGLPFWFKVVGFEIFFAIITVIGLILLIVPGLIIFRRYYLSPYYIVGKNLSIADAMRIAAEQTKPVSGWVWGTLGVSIVLTFLAIIVSAIRFVGPILAVLVSLIYFFGPALRWHEVSQPAGKKRE